MLDNTTDIKNINEDETKEKVHLCLRCGKPLKSSSSVELGIGPTCYQKLKQEHKNKMHNLFLLNK